MSRDNERIDTLVTEHVTLTAGALLARNLAWMMEQNSKVVPPVSPEMLSFIANGMLERLDTLEEAVERLQAVHGGVA